MIRAYVDLSPTLTNQTKVLTMMFRNVNIVYNNNFSHSNNCIKFNNTRNFIRNVKMDHLGVEEEKENE